MLKNHHPLGENIKQRIYRKTRLQIHSQVKKGMSAHAAHIMHESKTSKVLGYFHVARMYASTKSALKSPGVNSWKAQICIQQI